MYDTMLIGFKGQNNSSNQVISKINDIDFLLLENDFETIGRQLTTLCKTISKSNIYN